MDGSQVALHALPKPQIRRFRLSRRSTAAISPGSADGGTVGQPVASVSSFATCVEGTEPSVRVGYCPQNFWTPYARAKLHPDLHRQLPDAADEVGEVAPRPPHHLDVKVASEDPLPKDLQLQIGQSVAHAAVDAGAVGEMLGGASLGRR